MKRQLFSDGAGNIVFRQKMRGRFEMQVASPVAMTVVVHVPDMLVSDLDAIPVLTLVRLGYG